MDEQNTNVSCYSYDRIILGTCFLAFSVNEINYVFQVLIFSLTLVKL